MKIHFLFVIYVVLAFPTYASADELEVAYLERSKTVPTIGIVLENDELMRFGYDINNDGEPEIFFSKASLRAGKQGNTWVVYTKSGPQGSYVEAGVVTFSADGFWPAKWKKDGKTDGFYTYWPAGGGKGSLYFHAFENGKLREAERKEISQHDEAMKELNANRKEIEVKKAPIKK